MTAVEWLVNKILVEMELYTDEEGNWIDNARIAYVNSYKDSIDLKEFVQQALELEKQQMLHFWQGGLFANESGGKNFETYYNETYKPSA